MTNVKRSLIWSQNLMMNLNLGPQSQSFAVSPLFSSPRGSAVSPCLYPLPDVFFLSVLIFVINKNCVPVQIHKDLTLIVIKKKYTGVK